jgi:hypothetical protein
MNLDHNEQVVKRRLAQKMEFLSADLAALVEPPGEESLQVFFQENKENYLSSPEYSFYQVPFFSSNHEDPAEHAKFILLENKQTTPDQMRSLGDNTSLSFRFSQADRMEIIKSLGEVFIANLDQLPLNQWTGPVASGLGWHLVFITEKTRSGVPVLEEVRSRVLRDFEREKERETREAVLTSLRDKYQISITAEDLDELTRNKLAATGK